MGGKHDSLIYHGNFSPYEIAMRNEEMKKRVVIFASSRKNGMTFQAVNEAMSGMDYDFIDLCEYQIGFYDYEHKNKDDDFLPLIERIISYDDIILASPVYWYAPSAQMKVFIDRLSDLLYLRADLGGKLVGKNMYVIASYGTDFPKGYTAFEIPLSMTAQYMNMNFRGCFYYWNNASRKERQEVTERFQKTVSGYCSQNSPLAHCDIVLRPANLSDRKNLFDWMYQSDASKSMVGLPLFPEKPVKSWEEFKRSWKWFYFQRPLTSQGHVFVIEHDGEEVGGIAYHVPDDKNRAELDIWLKSEAVCGKGIGFMAITTLCEYLCINFGIMFFWVMPSARNPRSIRVFEKAGFKRLPLTADKGRQEFGFQDYHDSIYLLKDMSVHQYLS